MLSLMSRGSSNSNIDSDSGGGGGSGGGDGISSNMARPSSRLRPLLVVAVGDNDTTMRVTTR